MRIRMFTRSLYTYRAFKRTKCKYTQFIKCVSYSAKNFALVVKLHRKNPRADFTLNDIVAYLTIRSQKSILTAFSCPLLIFSWPQTCWQEIWAEKWENRQIWRNLWVSSFSIRSIRLDGLKIPPWVKSNIGGQRYEKKPTHVVVIIEKSCRYERRIGGVKYSYITDIQRSDIFKFLDRFFSMINLSNSTFVRIICSGPVL